MRHKSFPYTHGYRNYDIDASSPDCNCHNHEHSYDHPDIYGFAQPDPYMGGAGTRSRDRADPALSLDRNFHIRRTQLYKPVLCKA